MGRPRSPLARMRLHRRKNQYDEWLIKVPIEIAEGFDPKSVFECKPNGDGFVFVRKEQNGS